MGTRSLSVFLLSLFLSIALLCMASSTASAAKRSPDESAIAEGPLSPDAIDVISLVFPDIFTITINARTPLLQTSTREAVAAGIDFADHALQLQDSLSSSKGEGRHLLQTVNVNVTSGTPQTIKLAPAPAPRNVIADFPGGGVQVTDQGVNVEFPGGSVHVGKKLLTSDLEGTVNKALSSAKRALQATGLAPAPSPVDVDFPGGDVTVNNQGVDVAFPGGTVHVGKKLLGDFVEDMVAESLASARRTLLAAGHAPAPAPAPSPFSSSKDLDPGSIDVMNSGADLKMPSLNENIQTARKMLGSTANSAQTRHMLQDSQAVTDLIDTRALAAESPSPRSKALRALQPIIYPAVTGKPFLVNVSAAMPAYPGESQGTNNTSVMDIAAKVLEQMPQIIADLVYPSLSSMQPSVIPSNTVLNSPYRISVGVSLNISPSAGARRLAQAT